jgi:mono/diheme cytochrome c family protein
MRLRSLAIGVAVLGLVTSAAAKTVDKATQGKIFAIEACSACHQVEPGQKPPPPVHDSNFDEDVTAPSFVEIARGHGTDKAYLRKHITDPAWPMRQQLFDEYYLDDVIAYIRSLDSAKVRKPLLHRKSAGADAPASAQARGP